MTRSSKQIPLIVTRHSKGHSKGHSTTLKGHPSKKLMYTLLVGRPDAYLPMFELMWRSLGHFSPDMSVDFLIIGNRPCLRALAAKGINKPVCVKRVHALEVPTETDLHDALLRKLDITNFKGTINYDVVMYIDCDIIIKTPISDIFERALKKPDKLHASIEYEDFNHPFFGFENYTPTEIGNMLKIGSTPFNDGIFVFSPKSSSADILGHFKKIRQFSKENVVLRKKYYDQSFFNDHFNKIGLASTKILSKRVIIFPKPGKLYLDKNIAFVHFAGLQGYHDKAQRMEAYLEQLM